VNSFKPTSSAPLRCCRKVCATGDPCRRTGAPISAACMFRRMRCSDRSELRVGSPKRHPTHRTHPIRRAKPPQIIWSVPGARHSNCLTMITNCSNNYGPYYHFPEKLIPHMIIKGLAGEPLPRLRRRPEHPGLALCSRPRQRPYAIFSTRFHPSGGSSRRRLISFVQNRRGHDRRWAIDASKLERELGWGADEHFESGIEKTVHWYCEQQPWWRAILERGYAANRTGLG
jgi:hypothetical protein